MSQKNIGSGISDQIINELIALGTEAKRKNPEIRHACDHSIDIIKPFSSSAPAKPKNDFQITVRSHPEFIAPWILACLSKNSKLILSALKTLSKIIQLQLLPDMTEQPQESIDVIEQTVDALYETANGTEEIQIKLLQLLPSFCQLYAFVINDQTLSKLLLICSNLQGINKSPMIVNTAQATFTQLLDIAFSKVDSPNALPSDKKFEVPIDNNQVVMVDQYVYDVQRLVLDLCTLIEHHKPSFLQTNYISENFGFEVLESLIKNNANIFLDHNELAFLLRTKVAPLLLRFMSSSKDFTLMVKVSRVISLLLNEEFDVLRVESEVTLSLLTHLITKESGSPNWKRIMVLEVYVNVFKNKTLLKKIFMEYDNNLTEERKRVLHDILTLCKTLVLEQKHLLNTGDLIQPQPAVPTIASTQTQKSQPKVGTNGLRASDFDHTVKYIDCIDKQEAPQVPDSYNLFLISNILFSLSDCIQSMTLELMKYTDPIPYLNSELILSKNDETLKQEYECAVDFISNTWELQLDMTDVLVYSTLDDTMFSNILKLLENLCYCAGVLSLEEIKQTVLKYLGICTLKLEGTFGYKSRVQSIGESIVGTISSTLGHAVSNISNNNNSNLTNQTNAVKLYPRTINTRQTLIFHTLIRLAVSLGSNLKQDWDIILKVLQWISYYVDGPTGIKSQDVPPISPYLDSRDLKIIEHSLGEFKKSIVKLDDVAYTDLIQVIIKLSDRSLQDSNESSGLMSPIHDDGSLEVCGFNRVFYIGKLADISVINPLKFLIMSKTNLSTVTGYFSKIVCERDYTEEIRMMGSRSFNQLIRVGADSGFEAVDEVTLAATESQVLSNMSVFLENVAEMPLASKLLTANCEGEVILQLLDTLKFLVDRYGSRIENMWGVVAAMLNVPFKVIENTNSSNIKDKNIDETTVAILKSSFETLKVILDEVLHCIPKLQLRVIIDSLYNFVSQKYDLNISFNSVSYFWLISDYIKDKLESETENIDFFSLALTEQDLVSVIEKTNNNDSQYYQYIWIYLVLKLARAVPDERVQVRNGAIMTTFGVIESFSYNERLLSLLYDIVLQPYMLQLSMPSDLKLLKPSDQKEWMESYMNITSGIFKIFLAQASSNFDSEQITKMWRGIVTFFIELINLDYNWLELNISLFKSYSDVLSELSNSKLSNELLELLFEPWVSVKINYNFNNPSKYQEMLCSFVNCFLPSFSIFKPIMNVSRFEKMLLIQNACIKYPVLINTRNDDSKCTSIQELVITNLEKLELVKTDEHYYDYELLVVQQLNIIIALPFHTRDLILKKLGDKGIKVPSFIAASYQSMIVLQKHMEHLIQPLFINNGLILNIIKALTEPSKNKDVSMEVMNSETNEKEVIFLWEVSFELLSDTIVNTVDLILSSADSENTFEKESLNKLVSNFIAAFECCFVISSSKATDFDLHQYSKIKSALTKLFEAFYETKKVYQVDTPVVERFVSLIWSSSFFYEHDSIVSSVLPQELNVKTCEEFIDLSTDNSNWDIFGTTEKMKPTHAPRLSHQCLMDLTDLANMKKYPYIGKVGLPFFIARCAYSIRRFIIDTKLINQKPCLDIQILDLETVVSCLQTIFIEHTEIDNFEIKSKYAASIRLMMVASLPKIIQNDLQAEVVRLCTVLMG